MSHVRRFRDLARIGVETPMQLHFAFVRVSCFGALLPSLTNQNPLFCRIPINSIYGFILGTYKIVGSGWLRYPKKEPHWSLQAQNSAAAFCRDYA